MYRLQSNYNLNKNMKNHLQENENPHTLFKKFNQFFQSSFFPELAKLFIKLSKKYRHQSSRLMLHMP